MAKEIEIYTLEEICNMLHVTRRTTYNWIKDGKLKAIKVGREWRVTWEALQDFLQRGTEEK